MPSGTSLVTKKFGSLTVLRETDVEDIYVCRCKCGKEVELYRSQLVNRAIRHCGCRGGSATYSTKTHCAQRRGKDGRLNTFSTGEWNSWYAAKCRCCYSSCPNYPEYGGRGITICQRWKKRKGFYNFLEDMGPRPVGRTLDRVNVNGHYCKENCRWADKPTQNQNRRCVLEANGVELPPVVPMDLEEEFAFG